VLSWEWALLLGTYWVAILKVTRRVAAHSDVACLPPLPWQLATAFPPDDAVHFEAAAEEVTI